MPPNRASRDYQQSTRRSRHPPAPRVPLSFMVMSTGAVNLDSIGAPCKLSKNMRALHWVIKVGSLRTSLDFYEQVLGMRVLRHEEFAAGCEATCNGPYGGAWSKTMVGLGPESSNFVFELTYNYGIGEYACGNGVQHFAIAMPEAVPRARALGYEVEETEGFGRAIIHGPDGLRYQIVQPISGRAERFDAVVLRSSDLHATRAFWCGVLGMKDFDTSAGNLRLGWAHDQVHLKFVHSADCATVAHGESAGRIAFSCRSVRPFHAAAVLSGLGGILHEPVTLPTPGKADVEVTILADPDGYEMCFVGDVGFYDLALPTYDVIDWKARAEREAPRRVARPSALSAAARDTENISQENSPENSLISPGRKAPAVGAGMPAVADMAGLLSLLRARSKGTVVLDFGAGWCESCARLEPYVHKLAAQAGPEVTFAQVDS